MFLKVKVFPGAKREELIEKGEGKFELYTKEPAQDNRANEAARETVAQFLNVAKAKVRIVAGHHKPSKILELLE